jgi:hypothetical protein
MLITLGLSEIQVGVASSSGVMPGSLTKIGKAYKDSCKLNQGASDVTEHFEEGKPAPVVRKKSKKMPVLTFSLMDPDVDLLCSLVGGELTETTKWGFDGTEIVQNKAIKVISEQGLIVDIPNGDVEAVINAEYSEKGIFLVDVTITPMAVTAGKPILAYPGSTLTVNPTTLSFTAAADSTGKTITATSTGNLTFAGGPSDAEWLTVTRSGKVATVKVAANTNSESRTANVTIIADGLTAIVPVTQAGA